MHRTWPSTSTLPHDPVDRSRWRQRVTHAAPDVDLDAAETAATTMLAALGLPVDSDDMAETPRRLVARLRRDARRSPTST